jgi:hypothetical protein
LKEDVVEVDQKMNFSYWKPPGVPERMCRVNIDADPRGAFRPDIRVPGIFDDWYKSTMGLIVITLGTPQCAGENFGYILEYH